MGKENQRGFILVDSPEQRQTELQAEMQHIWPLKDEMYSLDKFLEDYLLLGDSKITPSKREMAAIRVKGAINQIRLLDSGHDKSLLFGYLVEEYCHNSEPTATYGIFLPTYVEAMKDKKIDKALLLGTYNIRSLIEFNAGVKYLYPQAECVVIDKNPAEQVKDYRHFIEGDILDMPFAANTFDSIQSNFLFTMLEGEKEKAFAEVTRVLKPNGQIILVEHEFIGWEIDQLIRENKLKILKKDRPKYFRRNEVSQFMRNSHGNDLFMAAKKDFCLRDVDSLVYVLEKNSFNLR